MTGGASDRPTITTPKDLATKLRLQRILPNSCRSHQTDKQVNFANSYGTHILSQPDLADTRSLGDEEALFARRDLIALLVDNSNRTPSGTWFERHRRHSGDLEHASFGLPPGIGDRTRAVTDHIVEAAPSLRVDGLANRTEYAQTGQIVFAHPGVAKAHESANSGWSGVEASDAVVLNELPPAVGVWVRRTALMHEDGGTVEQRAVDEVGVSVIQPGSAVHHQRSSSLMSKYCLRVM